MHQHTRLEIESLLPPESGGSGPLQSLKCGSLYSLILHRLHLRQSRNGEDRNCLFNYCQGSFALTFYKFTRSFYVIQSMYYSAKSGIWRTARRKSRVMRYPHIHVLNFWKVRIDCDILSCQFKIVCAESEQFWILSTRCTADFSKMNDNSNWHRPTIDQHDPKPLSISLCNHSDLEISSGCTELSTRFLCVTCYSRSAACTWWNIGDKPSDLHVYVQLLMPPVPAHAHCVSLIKVPDISLIPVTLVGQRLLITYSVHHFSALSRYWGKHGSGLPYNLVISSTASSVRHHKCFKVQSIQQCRPQAIIYDFCK